MRANIDRREQILRILHKNTVLQTRGKCSVLGLGLRIGMTATQVHYLSGGGLPLLKYQRRFFHAFQDLCIPVRTLHYTFLFPIFLIS